MNKNENIAILYFTLINYIRMFVIYQVSQKVYWLILCPGHLLDKFNQ